MIGQVNLVSKFKSYSIETFPKTLMLRGDKGAGKSTLLKEIAEYFNVQFVQLADRIDNTIIDEIYTSAIPRIYSIDLNELDYRKQNIILKFLEEPPFKAIVALECTDSGAVLETIINRCMIFDMEKYSNDNLLAFGDQSLLRFCSTPGQMKTITGDVLSSIEDIVKNIVDHSRISRASFANILTITSKVKCFGYSVFGKALKYYALNAYFFDDPMAMDYISRLLPIIDAYSYDLTKQNTAQDRATDKFAIMAWQLAREYA